MIVRNEVILLSQVLRNWSMLQCKKLNSNTISWSRLQNIMTALPLLPLSTIRQLKERHVRYVLVLPPQRTLHGLLDFLQRVLGQIADLLHRVSGQLASVHRLSLDTGEQGLSSRRGAFHHRQVCGTAKDKAAHHHQARYRHCQGLHPLVTVGNSRCSKYVYGFQE